MAISTRSIDISECAGAAVQFGAREPYSTLSLNIFMAHVTRGASRELLVAKPQDSETVWGLFWAYALDCRSLCPSRDLQLRHFLNMS